MSSRLGALTAATVLLGASSALAGTFYLPGPNEPVAGPPPLRPGTSAPQTSTEVRTPGRLDSREHVTVGIGPDGAPTHITVTQRIRIDGTGDYAFIVPAPATAVVAGPGSDSEPGLRDVGIVWQGFSDRHRLLSATATLRPDRAAVGLPLKIHVRRRGDATVVRLVDVARRRILVTTGRTTRAQLLTLLRNVRASYRGQRTEAVSLYLNGIVGENTKIPVAAALRFSGVIAQGSSRTTVRGLLGGRRPLQRSFVVHGAQAPTLTLRVDLLAPLEILPTQREIARAPHPLRAMQTALGAIATSLSYGRFLAAPTPTTPSHTSYAYRSVSPAAAVAATVRRLEDHTLAIVLAWVLGAAGLAGLAVWWARS